MERTYLEFIVVEDEAPQDEEKTCDMPLRVIHILEYPTHATLISYNTIFDLISNTNTYAL